MTDIITPLTEKEAINAMLATIGQSPINSLEDTLPLDATNARAKLKLSLRSIQGDGWNFNREFDYPLNLNSDNEIIVPNDCYTLDVNREYLGDIDPVIRKGKLYDRKNHTYKFDKNLKADITLILPFADLPEAAKDYCYLHAGVGFQASVISSRILDAYAREDLREAKRRFIRTCRNVSDNNLLDRRSRYRPGDVFK